MYVWDIHSILLFDICMGGPYYDIYEIDRDDGNWSNKKKEGKVGRR